MPRCPNVADPTSVKLNFERLAAQSYVGQQQAWNYVSAVLEAYVGLAPRATCADWTLHFTGPSGSGKSFLAELIADAALEPWDEEAYSLTQLGVGATGGALGGAFGFAVGGPITAGLGSAVGAFTTRRAWQAALAVSPTLSSTFRAPTPFPSQCGVLQHKFARGSSAEEVAQWEYRVARELLREPTSVFVVDDIGRLRDAAAFEHFGRLVCGVGGNTVPEFRTGPGDSPRVAASDALFVLTSDLELDPSETSVSCEMDQWEPMLDAVRTQSSKFWSDRNLHIPDWWEQIPLVPFREVRELSSTSPQARHHPWHTAILLLTPTPTLPVCVYAAVRRRIDNGNTEIFIQAGGLSEAARASRSDAAVLVGDWCAARATMDRHRETRPAVARGARRLRGRCGCELEIGGWPSGRLGRRRLSPGGDEARVAGAHGRA